MFPFDAEVLAASQALYNQAIWPAQPVALLLALAAVWLMNSAWDWAPRALGALLAAGWLWCGAVFFLQHRAQLDFVAPVYGWAFLAEAALLVWVLVWRGAALRPASGLPGGLALVLAAAAILGLPLVSGLTGPGFAAAGIVGVAPDPTALLTLALLPLVGGRLRWLLLVVPLLWAGVAGVTGWVLGLADSLVFAGLAVSAVAGMLAAGQRAG